VKSNFPMRRKAGLEEQGVGVGLPTNDYAEWREEERRGERQLHQDVQGLPTYPHPHPHPLGGTTEWDVTACCTDQT